MIAIQNLPPFPRLKTPGGFRPQILGVPCPPGYHYDVTGQYCVPDSGEITCPIGWHWDIQFGQCMPDNQGGGERCPPGWFFNGATGQCESQGGGGSQTTTGAGEGPITVTIDAAKVLGETAANAIADAVKAGIQAGIDQAAKVAQDTTDRITTTLGAFSNNLFGWVKDALKFIGEHIDQIFKAIADNIAPILEKIGKFLEVALEKVASTIQDVLKDIAPVLDRISEQVQKINDELIQPIATFINTTVKTIADLTTAIEKDLHDGLSGLVKIPGDIANGLASLDASLNRTIQQIGVYNKEVAESQLTFEGKNISGHVDDLYQHGKLSFPTDAKVEVHRRPKEHLSDACTLEQITVGFSKIIAEGDQAPTWLKWIGKVAMDVIVASTEILAQLEQVNDLSKEQVKKTCPIRKLDPGSVIEALRRGFIDQESAANELAVQGFDANRRRVLNDLFDVRLDAGLLTDAWFRSLVDDNGFRDGLVALGYTADQISLLKEQAVRVLDVDLAITAWKRGLIQDDELTGILEKNRIGERQAELIFNTVFRFPTMGEELNGRLNREALGRFTMVSSDFDTRPDWWIKASRAEGVDDNTSKDLWWSHWNIGDVNLWINLYFRGIRTRTELGAVMDRYAIPRELQDDFIQGQRALIPFRTVPAMVAAGILTETEARVALEAHGYTTHDALKLIAYATRAKKSSKAATAQELQGASLSAAKTLFDDGAITEQQYRDVLKEHGMGQDTIDTTVAVAHAATAAKTRKEVAQGIVDEYAAGLITKDVAIQQLAAQNFTIAEQAKYLRQLRSAKTAVSKIPGEPELNHMMRAGVITENDYVDALEAQGFSQKWANAYLAVRTQPSTQSPPAPTG